MLNLQKKYSQLNISQRTVLFVQWIFLEILHAHNSQ